jgi:hypothetical protein
MDIPESSELFPLAPLERETSNHRLIANAGSGNVDKVANRRLTNARLKKVNRQYKNPSNENALFMDFLLIFGLISNCLRFESGRS